MDDAARIAEYETGDSKPATPQQDGGARPIGARRPAGECYQRDGGDQRGRAQLGHVRDDADEAPVVAEATPPPPTLPDSSPVIRPTPL